MPRPICSRGELGYSLDALFKNFDRRFVGAMKKQFASPIEEIAFRRIHVGSNFVLVHRGNKLSIFFVDLRQQVMQFAGVPDLLEILHQLPGLTEIAGKEVCQR